jgi:hypothetical protein
MTRIAMFGLFLVAAVLTASGPAEDRLAAEFAAPPDSAKPWVYWWWLNGYVTKDGIVRDLDTMKRLGISGALVFHAGSGPTPKQTDFMSRPWRDLFRFAVEEAGKRRIEIGLNICAGWNAGGPWVRPKTAAKTLVHAMTHMSGPIDFDDILPKPDGVDTTYHDIAVLAWPTRKAPQGQCLSEGVQDLTDKMDAMGHLRWAVPDGHWLVIRFGWKVHPRAFTKCTGGQRYLEIDPLDAEAMDTHFAHTVAVLLRDVAPFVGKTFNYLHIDSGEFGTPNWTPRFREEFRRRRGYDPFPYLAAKAGMTINNPALTERFLEDYDRTLGDLIVEYHHGRLGQLGRRHGLRTHSESAGYQKPCEDSLRAMGCNDICMSEFWSRRSETGERYIHQLAAHQLLYHDGIKNASSAAHIYGRRIVQAEAFTVTGHVNWSKYPFALKDIGDRAFCAGLNRNVLCFMVHQPEEHSKPGYAWPNVGANFDRHLTWWPMGGAWLTYLGRCQYLLQAGSPCTDVCYFQGEWVPSYVSAKWAMDPPLPAGFDCDTVSPEVLTLRATAQENGRLLLANRPTMDSNTAQAGDEPSYDYLVLSQSGRWQPPPREIFGSPSPAPLPETSPTGSGSALAISPVVMRKLIELVEGGVTLIGPRPERAFGLTNYPESDAEIRQLADTLWGSETKPAGQRTVGAGRVIWGRSVTQVVHADGRFPDLEIREDATTAALNQSTLSGIPSPSGFDWVHRRIDGADVYFVTNLRNAAASADCIFRVAGKQPELWDAVTGTTRDAPAFTQTDDGRTIVPLCLPPRGSLFVVFRQAIPQSQNGKADTNHPTLSPMMEIDGPWTVDFDPKWGGPNSVVFQTLVDWTERSEPGIRYYSGTATYRKTFDLPQARPNSSQPIYLDLGCVKNLATVRLNGKRLGVVWTAPWQVEIKRATLRPTKNKLEVDVVNLWPNRLIGDAALPPADRFTATNVASFKKDSPLLPSGLLGPVRILTVKTPPLISRENTTP